MSRHRSTGERGRRARIWRALLAGGLVLGVGATATLAAWNDSEVATGSFAASVFDTESQSAGSPTYGPSKAALEAFSAILAKDLDGTGVTVNVLVPGGATNTGMIPAEAPYAREDMIQPEVMAPPLVWLVSNAAGGVTGRRFLAIHWDPSLPPEQAAQKAGAPVAWTDIATMPIEPPRRG